MTTDDSIDGGISGAGSLEIMVRQSAGVSTRELVIDKIIEISREIPANVNQINSSFAEYLAGRFLIGIDLCGELAAFASGHTLKMTAQKRKEYSVSYHVRAVQAGCKTVKDKEQYPYMDEAYLEADNKYIEAVVFEKMVEDKRDLLKKAHYHMRKLADKDPEGGVGTGSKAPVSNDSVSGRSNNNSNSPSLGNNVWDSEF